jgi:glycosyltransferase involved in cell wall biosynthesis
MSFRRLKISVVTPTFNQAPFIAQTLQSVLDQKLGPRLQYIIQDACSTDGTETIVRSFEDSFRQQGVDWRYVREKDAGQADAINRGWRVANGDVLGFLNSDDLFRPGALHAVLDYFEGNPCVKWAYGGWRLISAAGALYKSVCPTTYSRSALLNFCNIGQPSCFFRRELLSEVGSLDMDLHLAMDYDLWLRMAARYPAGIIPFELAEMRYYAAAKSAASARQQLREVLSLGTKYSRPLGWRRCCQYFYYMRGLAVVSMGFDLARRIERMETAEVYGSRSAKI